MKNIKMLVLVASAATVMAGCRGGGLDAKDSIEGKLKSASHDSPEPTRDHSLRKAGA